MSDTLEPAEKSLAFGPPPSLVTTIGRYAATARHLRLHQAVHWAYRRSLGRRYHVAPDQPRGLRPGVAMEKSAARAPSSLLGNTFTFLNHRRAYDGAIDWDDRQHSRLWSYNLHYFDYALDPFRSPAWVQRTMSDWVAAVPPQRNVGWEPYPASLRIVNWIKFALLRQPGEGLGPVCSGSLFQQIGWLAGNLEHEIQANHLLKNAKALVFGGAYFDGAAADRWLASGLDLFQREIKEQFLGDGGHYERSAMYHAIALEDLLDVISLAAASAPAIPAARIDPLREIAKKAAAYLSDLLYPHGGLPLFNDSAATSVPAAADLLAYAGAVLGGFPAMPETALIDKAHSGYYGYRQAGEMMLIDAGPLGPEHQPGHGHCDTLSFELVIGGRPVVVDSGVYDYENTTFRRALRGTAAHNTVRIDRQEQSDVWGCFRVGRRAAPGPVGLMLVLPEAFHFRGSHDGYRHLDGQPMHHREIDCRLGQSWGVTDRILGRGRHLLESFLHFHPDCRVRAEGDRWLVTDSEHRPICSVRAVAGAGEILPDSYCPDFGIRRDNTTLRFSMTAELPASFGYVIEVA